MDTLARVSSESAVREIVGDLNDRIERAWRGLVDGPPVILDALDVDEVVAAWRRDRTTAP
jgi:hypothetical protein